MYSETRETLRFQNKLIVKDNYSSSSWSWYVLWHGVRRNRTQNLYAVKQRKQGEGRVHMYNLG